VPEKIDVPRRTRCFASDGPEQEDPFQQNVLRVLPLAEPLAEAFDVVVLEGFVERTIRLASLSNPSCGGGQVHRLNDGGPRAADHGRQAAEKRVIPRSVVWGRRSSRVAVRRLPENSSVGRNLR
jgi:hypothetical protein